MSMTDIKITDMGKARVKATPSGGGTPIPLFCTSKSVLGFPDAPTWNYKDDNPNMEVGMTRPGKPDGANPLEFRMAYTPSLLAQMTSYQAQGKKFEIEYVYDDEMYSEVLTLVVHNCFILNPGSSETTEIDGVAFMDVKFQPLGGGKLTEIMTITTKART